MEEKGLCHIDKRLSRIQSLLEQGNRNLLDSRQEITEEISHLHEKVDKVQDTVTYIKKKITTFTPLKLGFFMLVGLSIWIIIIYYFNLHD